MDVLDSFNYKLLANPFHLKKKNNNENKEDEFFTILNKKFPGKIIKEEDHIEILKKIDFILFDITITNIVNETIDDIIESIEYG